MYRDQNELRSFHDRSAREAAHRERRDYIKNATVDINQAKSFSRVVMVPRLIFQTLQVVSGVTTPVGAIAGTAATGMKVFEKAADIAIKKQKAEIQKQRNRFIEREQDSANWADEYADDIKSSTQEIERRSDSEVKKSSGREDRVFLGKRNDRGSSAGGKSDNSPSRNLR